MFVTRCKLVSIRYVGQGRHGEGRRAQCGFTVKNDHFYRFILVYLTSKLLELVHRIFKVIYLCCLLNIYV